MTVVQLGVAREGGGCLFVVVGKANVQVNWTLTGSGSLTPFSSYTDANGIATAIWEAGTAIAGESITVKAEYHAE